MHPGDQADAVRVGVGRQDQLVDGAGVGEHRLPLHRHRQCAGVVQLLDDRPGLLLDLVQRLRPVQALAPGEEPAGGVGTS